MFLAVPFLIRGGVVETIIGAEVDQLRPGAQEMRSDRSRDAVRQTTEDAIGPRGDGDRPHILQPQIEPAGERRMDRSDMRVAFLAARERGDLDLGMPQEQLDEFEGRITRGPENGDARHGRFALDVLLSPTNCQYTDMLSRG